MTQRIAVADHAGAGNKSVLEVVLASIPTPEQRLEFLHRGDGFAAALEHHDFHPARINARGAHRKHAAFDHQQRQRRKLRIAQLADAVQFVGKSAGLASSTKCPSPAC